MSDPLSKRNFFLMLSIFGGQQLAAEAGFSLPSEEVQKSEVVDVFKKWLILAGAGITTSVKECADWAVGINEGSEVMSESEKSDTIDALTSFGVALIGFMLDSGTVTLGESVDLSQDMTEQFIRELFKTVIEDFDE